MPDPLITVEELRTLLPLVARGEVSLLDVRYRLGGPAGREEFVAGHVPGAVYVDLDTDLASSPGAGGRHPLPSSADFEAAMRRVGVGAARPVVVYDDWSAHAAARCWWLLRHHGVDDVRVLDGGWAAWRAAGAPVDTGERGLAGAEQPGDVVLVPGATAVVDAEQVAQVAQLGVLLDARAPERFRGEIEPIDPVAGHIPGARNAPSSANLADDGRFLPPEILRERYAALGAADPDTTTAVYCGSGVTAAHDVLAMEVAGLSAALYPGSWSEWVGDPSRPVARGEG
ncbi:sulfurtransferase [Nocardioides sp.]|uniref:sulfurtransferase n=1 Tax=Nocardioides sp. TaxID=35761 RepID=UPI003511BBFC